MNKIYWDHDKILMVTDQIEAVEHKHWPIQLFLSVEKELEICVEGECFACRCVAVNQNINHSFSTGQQMHLSMIIDPASDLSGRLLRVMDGNHYHLFDENSIIELQKFAVEMIGSNDLTAYHNFSRALNLLLGLHQEIKIHDDRIKELFHHLEGCNCDAHTIASFAEKVSLSPGRLSHLFREEVGMPLKGYIQFHQMKKAFLGLLNGMTITDASMMANFDSPSHFAAVTKRMMGMPASISLKNSCFLKVY